MLPLYEVGNDVVGHMVPFVYKVELDTLYLMVFAYRFNPDPE